jgi:hypothetical protein
VGATQSSVAGAGLFFVFIFLSGIWLSRSGKPLNGIILTVHKLISLAAVVFLALTIYQVNQAADLSVMSLIAGVVTGLFFLGAIITGGLLSTGKSVPAAILTAHQVVPFLTVVSTAATLYLLR